jgi:thymidylate synthase
MKQYLHALDNVLNNGTVRDDRTGTGTIGIFGTQQRYDLSKSFPAVTTKKLAWKSVLSELLWFLEGSTDERRLAEILHGTRDISKRTIWTDNANAQGVALGYENTDTVKELGPIYGKQWRSWVGADGEYDQLQTTINNLKSDPFSRRHIISAWNVAQIKDMALPPCHIMMQFYVTPNGKLDLIMYQRSADMFLGVPFNIASYSVLLHMVAQVTNLEVGEFIHNIGDAHIYLNHKDQVKEQLARVPLELPQLKINPLVTEINDFVMNDFELVGYESYATIKAPMAV